MNIATSSFNTSGRSDLVVLISVSAFALMLGSTGKVMSLASSIGAGSALFGKPVALLQPPVQADTCQRSCELVLQRWIVVTSILLDSRTLKADRNSAWRRRGARLCSRPVPRRRARLRNQRPVAADCGLGADTVPPQPECRWLSV